MRDFSGKGSLWCVSSHVQVKLAEALEKSRPDQFSSLLHSPLLQDSAEPAKQLMSAPTSQSPRQPGPQQAKAAKQQNRSLSALPAAAHPAAIVNPRLTHKLVLPPAARTTATSDCPTDIDAVNALLSMKSRSSSMPSSTRPESTKQGRRKQVFKPPMKKPHINPSK